MTDEADYFFFLMYHMIMASKSFHSMSNQHVLDQVQRGNRGGAICVKVVYFLKTFLGMAGHWLLASDETITWS